MTDQLVASEDVLRAVMQLRRQGINQVMSQLEATERDLAEYVIEETTAIFHDLSAMGGSAKQIRRLHARVQSLVLVVVLSLRQAQARLWQQDDPPTPTDDVSPPLMIRTTSITTRHDHWQRFVTL
ncbi:MAG TPA: hypothetical protein VK968_18280 [Roseimicrobium sp.]|nr:hypothetical protein [Roseimicrobium sp.]